MANNHQRFSLTASYTPNNECGMSLLQVSEDVNYISLYFKIINEYIDPKNFEDPIQTVVTDKYYTVLRYSSFTLNDIYIRK